MRRSLFQGSLIVVLVLAGAAPATLAAASEVEIERMTWPEVRDRLATGTSTVIVPTGGTEQNGAHMVIGKHNFIVAETARRIARGLGDALVAPVLAYTPEGDIDGRTGHMAYPGTISVPPAVFASLLEATARSFKAHGFKTIVFLGDSGPNQEPQDELASKLSAAWAGDGVRVVNASGYYGGNGGEAWLVGEGETPESIGTHAGIRDTSELLAAFPAGVRLEGARPDSSGASGDPSRASVRRGEMLLGLKVGAAIAEIRAAREHPAAERALPSGLWARIWRYLFG